MKGFIKYNRGPLIGGLLATVFTSLGVFLLGNLSGYEAKQLIRASLNGITMLCNTIVLASATILALLLTLLGISTGSTKSELKNEHYKQVLTIAKFDTILFIGTLILFQLSNIPITEAENIPTSWFNLIYWATLIFSSLLSGMMITVILMLNNIIIGIIKIVGLGTDHPHIQKKDETDPD
ncbi:hypothetical protein [Membranihabitans maritimus]|uniref:hypothetical protein n=1 Tax=Membranihabitans maritimus TaxID=2904244 RepID=UPI001F1DF6DD|nr:hypothetical protein [Membranihabitans maritimus]